jgi:dye decolorizing peroxidase
MTTTPESEDGVDAHDPADESLLSPEASPPTPGLTRRRMLLGTGAGIVLAGAAGAAGFALGRTTDEAALIPLSLVDQGSGQPVPAGGVHQAGVVSPTLPQRSCLIAVADLDRTRLEQTMCSLGDAIARLTNPQQPLTEQTPDGPGDLTITIGLGPQALSATAHPDLAAAATLPTFRGDDALAADRLGGDLLISVNASDQMILEPVLAYLTLGISGYRLRWSDYGYRGPADQGVTRNPMGYYDGIIVPRTPTDLATDVWIAHGPLAGGTICCVRRFQLHTNDFRALPAAEQDQVIGRHRSDGSPLSGGSRFDNIDLEAKADNGDPLVPTHAHARAAHPSYTASRLMLRRSYSYHDSDTDHGHIFISHQNDVLAFAKTQLRLDDVDNLMKYATPTATAAFAILPGTIDASGASRAFGSTLF